MKPSNLSRNRTLPCSDTGRTGIGPNYPSPKTFCSQWRSRTHLAATATELGTRAAAVTPPKPSLDIGRKASLTAMIRRVLEIRPAGDVFGTNIITAEVNRHFRERLRRPVKEKLVSITLKRLSSQGELRQVRAGRPHHEALYARVEG